MEKTDRGLALLWETIKQKEIYPIFRLTYLSEPTKPFTDCDFDDIESKSIAANNNRDVTGLLIVHNDKILQILEGREDVVRELYDKIAKDKRHIVSKYVSEVEDEERLLLSWSMVVRKMNNIPDDISEQYQHVYDDLLRSEERMEITIDHIDLFKSISLLASLPVSIKP